MPKAVEAKLKAEAEKKFPGDQDRQNRYVYGTLANLKKKRHKPHSVLGGK